MKRNGVVLTCWVLVVSAAIGCGVSSDGGQSGSGISAVRGQVVAVIGAEPDVADIRVGLAGTALTTLTDTNGRFELSGPVSGPGELRFERQRDGLFASGQVVIPAGGVLELSQIMIDSQSGEAHPAQQRVQFEGIVEALDCAGGTMRLTPKDDDPAATVFIVEVASATIRFGNLLLTCDDLRAGDRAQVDAETTDGVTLINAEVVLEEGENGSAQQVQFEGLVEALDCAGGTILLRPKDDDPQATVFTVEVASATIHRDDGSLLACDDLRVGDRFQVDAETTDGSTLINADLELEAGQDGPNDS